MTDIVTGLPKDFIDRLAILVPKNKLSDVLASFTSRRPTTIRANTLKTTVVNLHKKLVDQGAELTSVQWNALASIVNKLELRDLTNTESYKNGELYVQSLSSMVPPLVLAPRAGDKVLDIAAAPGSKTTQMAAMMENQGEIIANDTSHVRRYRLQANLDTQGVTIAKVGKVDGRSIWQEYPEYFDKTLVDVPCSMEGRFLGSDAKTYKDWSPKKVKILSNLQRWLLRSAISATKTGGIIVYSTCTLSPEENEGVIDWILQKEAGNIQMLPIDIDNLPIDPAVTRWGEKEYDPEVAKCARILPSAYMEGFFVAKIQKIASNIHSQLIV
jgi:16S rRNA (cytosine1407-C5)-methyltransferase